MIYFHVLLILKVHFNRPVECSAKEAAHPQLWHNTKSMAAPHTDFFNFQHTWCTALGAVANPIVNTDSLLTTLGNRISNF